MDGRVERAAEPQSLETRRRTYQFALGVVAPLLPWLAWLRRDEPLATPIYLLMFVVLVSTLAGLTTRRLAVARAERVIIIAVPTLVLTRLAYVTLIDPVPLGQLRQLTAETMGPTLMACIVVIYLAFEQGRARDWSMVLWAAFTALLLPRIAVAASADLPAGAALVRQSLTLAIISGLTYALASVKGQLSEERTRARTLDELAHTDALTGARNRRGVEQQLAEEIDRVARYGGHLSVALLDLDRFKQCNDQHGHAAGDRALVSVVAALAADLRGSDVLGRWGGDELLIVAPETPAEEAARVAQRWRAAVAELELEAGPHPVTTSVGVATLHPGDDLDSLLLRADRALYAAKSGGGDRVVSDAELADRTLVPAPEA
ncbi:MAG: GGDEF domain-containing protein [Nitriliruptor sp.]